MVSEVLDDPEVLNSQNNWFKDFTVSIHLDLGPYVCWAVLRISTIYDDCWILQRTLCNLSSKDLTFLDLQSELQTFQQYF